MDLNSRQVVWRSSLLLRRAARERRRRLGHELAAYRTASERADLAAAIERCTSPGREEIRRLVERAAARTRSDEATPFHLRT